MNGTVVKLPLDKAISKFIFFSFYLFYDTDSLTGGKRRGCETSTRWALSRASHIVGVLVALLGAVLIRPAPVAPLDVLSIVDHRKVACEPYG
jgi:hypothetical protein